MRKFEFYYDSQAPTARPFKEVIEVDDDTTEEEIREMFTDWIFNLIDSGYKELD